MYKKYAELRDKRNLTDYRVAAETGISTATLSNWKNGNYVPKFDKLLLLAKYFDVPVEYFAEKKRGERGGNIRRKKHTMSDSKKSAVRAWADSRFWKC